MPTTEDLQFAQSNAQAQPRRPVMLSWSEGQETRMLSVVVGLNPSVPEPEWILRAGEMADSAVIWSYSTADVQVIYNIIADALNQQAPAAVIPEFLRPKQAANHAPESVSAPGGMTGAPPAPPMVQNPYLAGQNLPPPLPAYHPFPALPFAQPNFNQIAAIPSNVPGAVPGMNPRASMQGISAYNLPASTPGDSGVDYQATPYTALTQRPGGDTVISQAPLPIGNAALTNVLEPGCLFEGRYEIVAEIGRGAMGTVYKARQCSIGRLVAMKVLLPELVQHTEYVQRFRQEADVAKNLMHPNVIVLHDFGYSNGIPYLVMDYVDGPSLQEVIEKRGYLDPTFFFDVFIQVCRGLSHAHDHGLVHRDLKPSNIKITKDNKDLWLAKILDFGVAKQIYSTSDQTLTRRGEVIGSPLYMSPEQCMADRLDARSDLYSLGCVMYEAASGVPPLYGSDAVDTMYKHLHSYPPSFQELCPELSIPIELEQIILKMLQKQREQRYQNADEVEKALVAAKAAVNSRSGLPQVTAIELLLDSKLVSPEELETARQHAQAAGREVEELLVRMGIVNAMLLDAAKRTASLVQTGYLKPAQGHVLLEYCHQSKLSFDDCIEQLQG